MHKCNNKKCIMGGMTALYLLWLFVEGTEWQWHAYQKSDCSNVKRNSLKG